jgi:LacI family transcriptional regulator
MVEKQVRVVSRPSDQPAAGQRRRVAVLTVRRHPSTDRVLNGIRSYADAHGPWDLFLIRHDQSLLTRSLEGFTGDGLIIGVDADQGPLADLPRDRPTVAIGKQLGFGSAVDVDHRAAGWLAAEHLMGRGLRRLGYFWGRDSPGSDRVWEGFETAAKDAGIEASHFISGPRMKPGEQWRLEDELLDLADWLADQPLPLGLLCSDDTHAQRALDSVRRAGLRCPDDVVILGNGNDEVFCQFCHPSVSSIDHQPERVGHEAAALLARMMNGQPATREPVRVQPWGVVERQSTDCWAVDDAEVASALQYIHEHLPQTPRVGDLVEHTGLSRSNLQRRFIASLGQSPGEAIRGVRLASARRYLLETQLSLSDITHRCGYKHISQLSREFRQQMGVPPSTFREQGRSKDEG